MQTDSVMNTDDSSEESGNNDDDDDDDLVTPKQMEAAVKSLRAADWLTEASWLQILCIGLTFGERRLHVQSVLVAAPFLGTASLLPRPLSWTLREPER